MKTQKTLSRILDGMILLVFILFFASAGFQDKNTSGWYQQWFPNMNGSSITSITFLDSLNGFAVTNSNSLLQEYILRTTNGGDNWSINYTFTTPNSNWSFVKIAFINSNTGFAFSWTEMFKTTNGGNNWDMIVNNLYCGDFAVINKDTMFAVSSSGFDGGFYRSINGGINWQLIWTNGTSGNPSIIYMFDKNMGYIQDGNFNYNMRRTTNGGFNWIEISNQKFSGIQFIDSLIGWKTYGGIQKTTNGGINWFSQQLPNISNSYSTSNLYVLNKDTVWMVGARKYKSAPVYKTTNGGLNWGYQIPDTTLLIYDYYYVSFINRLIGWLYRPTILLHTTSGGNDTTFFTGIKLVPDIVPEKFSLGQNYPNPFNPTTNIPFELKEPSHVTLKVFDARGREVKELVNGRWGTGKFIADFDFHHGGSATIATGIYFYQIIVSGESTHQTFTETKKMMVLK